MRLRHLGRDGRQHTWCSCLDLAKHACVLMSAAL